MSYPVIKSATKIILFVCITIFFKNAYSQTTTLYKTSTGKINFFSKTPVEDIKAESNVVTAFINTSTLKIAFSVKISSFHFPDKLMEEHFNERYMESDKKGYEIASFVGSFNDK